MVVMGDRKEARMGVVGSEGDIPTRMEVRKGAHMALERLEKEISTRMRGHQATHTRVGELVWEMGDFAGHKTVPIVGGEDIQRSRKSSMV